MDRFRTTFTLNDEEAVAALQESIEEGPNHSVRCRSQQQGLYPSTLKDFMKGFWLKHFQDLTCAGIKAKRPTCALFWRIG